MALSLAEKKAIVSEVAEVARQAQAAVLAEYRGLEVGEMTELRAKARESGVYLRVVRNTLAKRAFQDTEFACLSEALTGPLLIALSKAEPSSAARLLRDFGKAHDKLTVTALAMGGKLMQANQLEAMAKLPTYNEAIAILMGVMKAPIEKFVRTLAEPHAKLARTVAAIRDQKQQSN
ncbi:MAG: 50S ribosomal protein L10 [Legionellales bacterium]|nr:50S ribosomal protein L10 [Legionellales bacterium]